MTYEYNTLKDKTKIPDDAMHFDCSFRKVSVITELSKLRLLLTLECRHNNLTTLPELPQSLRWLYCGYNKLIELPELPNKLEELFCDYNNLTYIPELPKSLLVLQCNDNKLIELPDLPELLEYLDGQDNNIKYLSPVNCQMIKIINEVYLKNNPLTSDFMDTMDFIGSL